MFEKFTDKYLNEAKEPVYKKGQKVIIQLTHKGGVGKYADAMSKSKNTEEARIVKRVKNKITGGYKYELSNYITVSPSEIVGLAESVEEASKLSAKDFGKWKQEREYIKQMADNNTSSVYKIADYVQFLGLFTERQWEMFMYGRYEKDLQKTDPKTKNKIYKVLQKMFESAINENVGITLAQLVKLDPDTYDQPVQMDVMKLLGAKDSNKVIVYDADEDGNSKEYKKYAKIKNWTRVKPKDAPDLTDATYGETWYNKKDNVIQTDSMGYVSYIALKESLNEAKKDKFPKSFTVKDTLHYSPMIDGKPKKLFKGTYKLKKDKGNTAIYFNQAFKAEIEVDHSDITNFGRIKQNFKVNEAKVTAKTIDKLTNEIAKLTKQLKDNFQKYQKANLKGDEQGKIKHMKIAGTLTKEKKLKDAELERAIQNFGADMELDMNFESKDLIDSIDYAMNERKKHTSTDFTKPGQEGDIYFSKRQGNAIAIRHEDKLQMLSDFQGKAYLAKIIGSDKQWDNMGKPSEKLLIDLAMKNLGGLNTRERTTERGKLLYKFIVGGLKESVNEGKYNSNRDADDIFFLWDASVDDGRQGIEHGIGSYGNKRYSSFTFDDDVKGFDDFVKKVKALLKKNKWNHDWDGGGSSMDLESLHIYESVNEEREFGMFNGDMGKPTKLDKEVLDIALKALPSKITKNIAEVEGSGAYKRSAISPPTVSNKGQSRGEIEYTTIYIMLAKPMGRNKVQGITVGLRKRTSGPGTGYLYMSVKPDSHHSFGPDAEGAIEFIDDPSYFLQKLYNEKFKNWF